MEFYHFRIDYFDKKIDGYQTRWHYDASADFIERYVVPFLKSSDFIYNGQRIAGAAVEALKVYQSSAKYQDCRKRYNAEHQFPYGSDFLTCADCFADITADCIVRFGNAVKKDDVEKDKQKEKTPIVFISHREKDITFVEPLVALLEGMGLNSSNLFCSSIPGYWIPKGNIFGFLRDKFINHKIYVLFVHSPRFYESPVCLNEMGAAWAVKTNYFSLLTQDMTFDKMNGVVNSQDICIKVDDPNAGERLIDLRDDILEFLRLPPVEEPKWNRMSQAFLKAVNDIDYSQKGDVLNKSEQVEQIGLKAPKSANNAKALTYFRQALKEKDLVRQIKLYTKTIEIDPKSALAYSERGNAYFRQKEYDKAIEDYTKAIEIGPIFVDFYCNRGNAYFNKKDYDKAIDDYTKVIKTDPYDAEAYYCNRGDAYFNKTDYNLAIKDYTKAIGINPDYTKAYCNRGNAYFNKKDYDKAINDFNKTIGINPDYTKAYYKRGVTNIFIAMELEEEGRAAEALELYKAEVKDFDKVLELSREDDVVRVYAIRIKQECEEAIRRLEGGEEIAEPIPLPR